MYISKELSFSHLSIYLSIYLSISFLAVVRLFICKGPQNEVGYLHFKGIIHYPFHIYLSIYLTTRVVGWCNGAGKTSSTGASY